MKVIISSESSSNPSPSEKEQFESKMEQEEFSDFLDHVCEGYIEEVMQVLQKKPHWLHQKDSSRKNAIIYACTTKQYKVVKALLELGANPNELICHETMLDLTKTVIVQSIIGRDSKMLALFLEHGADLKGAEAMGNRASPMRHAIRVGSIEMIRQLMNANPEYASLENIQKCIMASQTFDQEKVEIFFEELALVLQEKEVLTHVSSGIGNPSHSNKDEMPSTEACISTNRSRVKSL